MLPSASVSACGLISVSAYGCLLHHLPLPPGFNFALLEGKMLDLSAKVCGKLHFLFLFWSHSLTEWSFNLMAFLSEVQGLFRKLPCCCLLTFDLPVPWDMFFSLLFRFPCLSFVHVLF